jgi:uncharacterized membrane protein
MSIIRESIVVDVPARTAYDQWTQFESFPRFMESVRSVEQITDDRLHWVVEVGGQTREWDARILEQIPDRKIAWTSTTEPTNSGTVSFAAIGPAETRVDLELAFEPSGLAETVGDASGVLEAQVQGDLRRFKEFIETRGSATGEYREAIP